MGKDPSMRRRRNCWDGTFNMDHLFKEGSAISEPDRAGRPARGARTMAFV